MPHGGRLLGLIDRLGGWCWLESLSTPYFLPMVDPTFPLHYEAQIPDIVTEFSDDDEFETIPDDHDNLDQNSQWASRPQSQPSSWARQPNQ